MAETASSTGRVLAYSGPAIGHLVRNTHPDGGLIGDGKPPEAGSFYSFLIRVRNRHRRHQRFGIGMQRIMIHLIIGAELHGMAKIHHQHAIGDMLHDRQIVGDKISDSPISAAAAAADSLPAPESTRPALTPAHRR